MKERLKQIWNDPVGSNILAVLIISILGFVYSFLKGLYDRLPIENIFRNIGQSLVAERGVPTWVVGLVAVTTLTVIFKYAKSGIMNFINQRRSDPPENLNSTPPIFHEGNGLHFFAGRIGLAFPGLRDNIEWYRSKSAIDRLERLLADPLIFRTEADDDGRLKPMWWFRAGSSMFVERFKRISRTKCLINHDELVVDKIAVYQDQHEFRNFVYVEVLAEKPVGAYKYPKGHIEQMKKEDTCYWEEYALLNEHPIKREEYDDGAATVNGKVIDTHGAELRKRYLTNYNFILTSNDSPFNSTRFDRDSGEILDGILNGKKKFSELFLFLMGFERGEGKKANRYL